MRNVKENYTSFKLTNCVDNPVTLAHIDSSIFQEEFAKRMNVTRSYISKLEARRKVTAKVLKKIKAVIESKK